MSKKVSSEKLKYEKTWKHKAYREFSPGEENLSVFLNAMHISYLMGQNYSPNGILKSRCKISKPCMPPHLANTLVDWGCGTGRASYKLCKEHGLNVTMMDIAGNCLDDKVSDEEKTNPRLTFIEHDITEPIDLPCEYGFCTDVMEHLPPSLVDAALDNIIKNSQHVFFAIANFDEIFGDHDEIQEILHLSVHDFPWWFDKISSKPVTINMASEVGGNTSLFSVTRNVKDDIWPYPVQKTIP
jgi:2-polyprenyl-3-methyl-5-hydroxy-6-metoxy-1,4-benzoquinol methylase